MAVDNRGPPLRADINGENGGRGQRSIYNDHSILEPRGDPDLNDCIGHLDLQSFSHCNMIFSVIIIIIIIIILEKVLKIRHPGVKEIGKIYCIAL